MHAAAFDELDPRTAYLLFQLRESVFVLEQTCRYLELDGRDLEPGTRHLWVEDDGLPVGYLRILSDDEARIGRVLVAKSHRGSGIANALMQAALETIGDRPSVLEAQAYLTGWYSRFGYEQTGPEYLEDDIPHVSMRRPARDA